MINKVKKKSNEYERAFYMFVYVQMQSNNYCFACVNNVQDAQ